MDTVVTVKTKDTAASYDIRIGHGLVGGVGSWAAGALSNRPNRAAIISNRTVFGLYGEAVKSSLADAGIDAAVYLIGDGERFKNLKTLERTLKFLGESKLTRTDAVIALGGGGAP